MTQPETQFVVLIVPYRSVSSTSSGPTLNSITSLILTYMKSTQSPIIQLQNKIDGKWRYLDPVESSQSCFRFPRNEGEYLQTIKSCHAVVCLLSMSCSRCRIYWFSLTKEYRGGPSGDDESSTYPFSVNNWKCRCLYRIISSRVDSGSIDELPPLSFPAILRRCGDWLNVDNGIRNNI